MSLWALSHQFAFWEMLQVCQQMPGLPQMRDDRRVFPRHREYLVERLDLTWSVQGRCNP